MTTPLPCPKCGKTGRVKVHMRKIIFLNGQERFHVISDCCGWMGPECHSTTEAIDAWNARAITPEMSELIGQNAELREAICSIGEWECNLKHNTEYCLFCRNSRLEGHAESCIWKKLRP